MGWSEIGNTRGCPSLWAQHLVEAVDQHVHELAGGVAVPDDARVSLHSTG